MDVTQIRDSRDVFENMAEGLRTLFLKNESEERQARERYLYYRALKILSRKVTKELNRLSDEYPSPVFTEETINELVDVYQKFEHEASEKMVALREAYTELIETLDEELAYRSVYRVEDRTLERLFLRHMLTRKLFINLKKKYEREASEKKD